MIIKSALNVSLLELKNLYAKSILGVAWLFLNPVLFFFSYYYFCVEMMGVQIQGFSNLASFLYIMLGLSSFLFMSNALLQACNGLIGSLDLFKNTSYDPGAFVIKFIFLSLFSYLPVLIFCLMTKFSIISSISATSLLVFFLYFLLFITFVSALVFLCSAIAVFFRDFVNILTWAVYCIMFISPFGMRGHALVEKSSIVYYMNPLNYFIVPFQELIFYDRVPEILNTILTTLTVLLFFGASKRFFDAVKEYMSDHA